MPYAMNSPFFFLKALEINDGPVERLNLVFGDEGFAVGLEVRVVAVVPGSFQPTPGHDGDTECRRVAVPARGIIKTFIEVGILR